jgi:MoaA/NifB/PqqE/SkfB family radical SAM enzyme
VTQLASLARRALRLAVARAADRPLPFSMTFILTHRCNFRCAYCDVPDAAGEEMSAEEYRRAIDELAVAGLARASFSGGEALLRRDAVDVIRHARRRGLVTSLNTNAWLAEAHLDALADALDMLVVSLDGPEAVHDLVRRRSGSYARVVRVLERARALRIRTATITVLSPANLHVVDDVLGLARRHGFWAYFQPAYADCFAHERGLDPALQAAALARVAAQLQAARDAGEPVGASPTYLARLSRGPAQLGDCARCHAGRYFGTVMPDGTVVPCHLTSRQRVWPNGREIGFARAFAELGGTPKEGPGCAIAPYQESDLIFGLDRAALGAALRRLMARAPGAAPPSAGRSGA